MTHYYSTIDSKYTTNAEMTQIVIGVESFTSRLFTNIIHINLEKLWRTDKRALKIRINAGEASRMVVGIDNLEG